MRCRQKLEREREKRFPLSLTAKSFKTILVVRSFVRSTLSKSKDISSSSFYFGTVLKEIGQSLVVDVVCATVEHENFSFEQEKISRGKKKKCQWVSRLQFNLGHKKVPIYRKKATFDNIVSHLGTLIVKRSSF